VASNFPDEDRSASRGGDGAGELPGRPAAAHPAYAEARPELRDRETYFAELQVAVHCLSGPVPRPRAAWEDDMAAPSGDTWT
jgi:hypothetical protein